MRNHSFLPRFDWSMLPDSIREFNREFDIFNYERRQAYLASARLEEIEIQTRVHFDLAHYVFNELDGSGAEGVEENLKAYMNRLGYILFDFIIPFLLKDKDRPTTALNLLEAYQNKCWFFDRAPRLQSAFKGTRIECYRALEQKMIRDLQHPHKGEERVQKFERLFRLLRADHQNYNFANFLHEFSKRVERKPTDVKLLLLDDEHYVWEFILTKLYSLLELRGKSAVVNEIKRTAEADSVARLGEGHLVVVG